MWLVAADQCNVPRIRMAGDLSVATYCMFIKRLNKTENSDPDNERPTDISLLSAAKISGSVHFSWWWKDSEINHGIDACNCGNDKLITTVFRAADLFPGNLFDNLQCESNILFPEVFWIFLLTAENFKAKFYTPITCSYLRQITKFYSIISKF